VTQRPKGWGKWHAKKYLANHEKLKNILRQANEGITKWELHKKSGLSRPRIDKHLKDFGDDITYKDRHVWWTTEYEVPLSVKLKQFEQIMFEFKKKVPEQQKQNPMTEREMKIVEAFGLALRKTIDFVPSEKKNTCIEEALAVLKDEFDKLKCPF